MMRAGLRLAIYPPPSDDKRGYHREHEIEEGQAPEAAPVVRHLPQAGAQLVDADDAVDREIRREYVTVGKNRIGEQLHIDRPELAGIRERASGSSFLVL